MTALALVVRVVAGALAGVVIALAAHFGFHLDQDTALTVVSAGVTAVGAVVLHWASNRWPVVGRLVRWLSRAAAAVPSASLSSSQPASPAAAAGPSNVRRVNSAGYGGGHPTGSGVSEPTIGPLTPLGVCSANPPTDQPPSTP